MVEKIDGDTANSRDFEKKLYPVSKEDSEAKKKKKILGKEKAKFIDKEQGSQISEAFTH